MNLEPQAVTNIRQVAVQRPAMNLVAALAATLLGGWAVLEVGNAIAGSRHWLLWILLLALSLAIVLPIVLEGLHHRFDPFNLKNIFLFYILMQFVVWPISAYTGIYDEEPFYVFHITFLSWRYSHFLAAELYVLLGVLAFYAGYHLLGSEPIPPAPPSRNRSWRTGRAVSISILLTVFSAVAFFELTEKENGFYYFITHIDAFRNTDLLGTGYLTAIISLAQLASLVMLCLHFETKKYRVAAYGVTLLAIALSLLGASRHTTVAAVVAYLIVRNYLGKPLRFNLKTVSAIAVLWLLNVAYVYFRRFGVSTFEELGQITLGRILFLIVPRFTGGESLARVVDITGQTGFQGGYFILRDLMASWVPRILWPAKPLSAGLVENTTFFPDAFIGGETGAAVPTLIGELYWTAGIFGVLIGMFVLGVFFRRAYDLVRAKNKNAIGVYSLVYVFAFFVNESLSVHLVRFLFQVAVWQAVMLIVRTRQAPEPSPAPDLGWAS